MSSTLSDPSLLLAFWTGAGAVGLTLLLAVAIFVLRLRLLYAQRRWERFVALWRPLLLGVLFEPVAAATLPALAPRDHRQFLRLWAYLHESVRGDAADRLNSVALALGLDAAARHLLVKGSRTEQLQAVLAAGYLRDTRAWPALVRIAQHRDGLLSVNAARALVRVDARRAARVLLPLLLARTDWDLGRIDGLLGDARTRLSRLLACRLRRLPPAELARALHVMRALRLPLADASLAPLLAPGQPPTVVAAALQLAESPSLADAVLRCLGHPDDLVRAQAARQMVHVATRADLPRLCVLLEDSAWAVRMATAQTLARLPFVSTDLLATLREGHPRARAQLLHAQAEREAA